MITLLIILLYPLNILNILVEKCSFPLCLKNLLGKLPFQSTN